ncbi:MAG TPA: thioredoxin, partial [Chlamydiales bacterium]|nr:thioredoxin [Chlamydiales bacterium]
SLYKDQIVGVVGGGDAAVLEALYLSNIAKEVHVFVRKDTLRAFEEKRIETLLDKPNVTMHYNTVVKEVVGDEKKVTHVMLQNGEKEPQSFSLDGLFLAIGSKPNSTLFQNVLKMDEKGYIRLMKDQQTSIEGVYAIGDIVDPVYKQAISAAGDGAKAALQAQQFVSDRMNGLIAKKKQAPQQKETFTAQVIEILSREQFEAELKSEIPIVVDFYASWCGPCKRISPIIESSASKLSGKVKFLKVNVDKVLELSKTYDIRSMPTVLVIDSTGTVVERKVGTEQIVHLLKQLRDEQGAQ